VFKIENQTDALPAGGRKTGSVTDAISGAPISGGRVTLTMVVDVPGGSPPDLFALPD
jgi:hypothetical protein